jgi:hypothetical protein
MTRFENYLDLKSVIPFINIVITMARIYEIYEIRARQIRLAKLRKMLGELFHCVAIPPPGMVLEELTYILPACFLRHIDDLSISEMDDLLNGNLKFFIIR